MSMTRRQHQLLDFLAGRLKETGVCPSFAEMKDALGLKSKCGIYRLISGLEEREYIFRFPRRARALQILKLPHDLKEKHGQPDTTFSNDGNALVAALLLIREIRECPTHIPEDIRDFARRLDHFICSPGGPS